MGPRGRELARARPSPRSAAGLVPARRPRPRPASRPDRGTARGRAALGRDGALARALGLGVRLLPASDDAVRTWLDTPAGSFPFQTWFVERGHRDEVDAVRYEGPPSSTPAPGVLEALDAADVIVIAPSNPYVSIGPSSPCPRSALLETRAVPASPSARSSAGARSRPGRPDARPPRGRNHSRARRLALRGLIDALVFDEADADGAEAVAELGITPIVAPTLMTDDAARRRLAESALAVAGAGAGAALRIAIVGGTGGVRPRARAATAADRRARGDRLARS